MNPVKVHILDKDYLIGCSESERPGLVAAAEYLSEQMRVIRDNGKVIGSERIAVMAALNITHELLSNDAQSEHFDATLPDRISALLAHVNDAIKI